MEEKAKQNRHHPCFPRVYVLVVKMKCLEIDIECLKKTKWGNEGVDIYVYWECGCRLWLVLNQSTRSFCADRTALLFGQNIVWLHHAPAMDHTPETVSCDVYFSLWLQSQVQLHFSLIPSSIWLLRLLCKGPTFPSTRLCLRQLFLLK